MRVNRRNVLRDLGTFGVVSALPSFLPILAGCKQTHSDQMAARRRPAPRPRMPESGKPNTLRILLEGPWIICRPSTSASVLQATAVMDSSHKCFCGVWDDGLRQLVDPVTGTGGAMQLSGPQTWAGTVQNLNASNKFQATLDAFTRSLSYIQDGTVTPALATDIVLTLPFPDYCILGGKYKAGNAPHSGRANFVPHTTVVLGYSENAGKALSLIFPDPASPLNKINLPGGNDIIFRLAHMVKIQNPSADSQHVVAMFTESMKRISPNPNRTLALSDVCNDMTPVDSGVPIGPQELGLPSSMPASCEVNTPGQMHVMSSAFANCVGGVMGVGP